MDPLSIDQLRTFVAIVQEGSYTAAAEKLFRSQPALSLQIKKLEEQLGSKVLERNGRQTRPTAAGEVLLSYAIRILDLNEEVVNKLSVTDTEGSVKIGVLEEVAIGPLVDLLTKFGRLCTKIDLDFRVATSWELSRLIKENKICLAVRIRICGKSHGTIVVRELCVGGQPRVRFRRQRHATARR